MKDVLRVELNLTNSIILILAVAIYIGLNAGFIANLVAAYDMQDIDIWQLLISLLGIIVISIGAILGYA